MSDVVRRRRPSASAIVWSSIQVAALLLAITPGPVLSARRSSVSELESKDAGRKIGGRRLMMDNEYYVIDEVGYEVLDVVREQYDSHIGCYGGYGLYGYYGYWSGQYGSYDGDLFVDYQFDIDGYMGIEEDADEWGDRRMLAAEADDGSRQLRNYYINSTDSFTDYDLVVQGAFTYSYVGTGWGNYYGYVPLYAYSYGGELVFEGEDLETKEELEAWITELLDMETRKQAAEEKKLNEELGQWAAKAPAPPSPPKA